MIGGGGALRATHLGPGDRDAKPRRKLYTHREPPSIEGVVTTLREDGSSVRSVWATGSWTMLTGSMPVDGEHVVEAKYYFGSSSPEHGIDASYTIGWCETPEAFCGPFQTA